MTTVLIVCAIIVTIAIVTAVVYLVITLGQVRRMAREAETFFRNVNQELDTIEHITGAVASFVDRFTSPWARVGNWFGAFVSELARRKRKAGPSGAAPREEVAI